MGLRNAARALACTAGLLFITTTAFGQKTNLVSFVDLNGGQHVFFQDANFDVNQLFYLGGTSWSDQDLTALYGGPSGSADSPLTGYVDVDGGEHIFYLDNSGDLNQLFYVGGTSWIPQDLTALYGGNKPAPSLIAAPPIAGAPTPAAASMTSYLDFFGGQHVAYLDANGHINQFFYVGGTSWFPQDLTASYGGSAVVGAGLTAWSNALGEEHIAYLDTNSNLNQLVYAAGLNSWANQNMTMVYGGNTPAAGSFLANFTDSSGFAHIVYLDSNQHLNQLVSMGAAAWTAQDLTASYGGNLAATGSQIAAWSDIDGIQHIAYLDADQNVNQLFYAGGFVWGTENLTQIFGGTKAAAGGSLTAYQTPAGGSQNIVYIDANEHVSQLFNFGAGTPWMPQDLTALYGGNAPELKVVKNVQ